MQSRIWMGLLPARDNRYLLSRCINEKIRNITVKYNELPLLNPYNPDWFIFSVHSRVSSSFELFFNKIIYFLSKRQHFEAWKIVASLLPSQKALPLIALARRWNASSSRCSRVSFTAVSHATCAVGAQRTSRVRGLITRLLLHDAAHFQLPQNCSWLLAGD